MPSIFRTPVAVTFVDEDNHELAHVVDVPYVPRVGENVRLARVPFVVERVGYDLPGKEMERVWIVCRPA